MGFPCSPGPIQNVDILNKRSLAKSITLRFVPAPLKWELYPNVKILHDVDPSSSASQGGQKLLMSLSQHHVFLQVPPKPCTKMRSATGSEHSQTRCRPKGSSRSSSSDATLRCLVPGKSEFAAVLVLDVARCVAPLGSAMATDGANDSDLVLGERRGRSTDTSSLLSEKACSRSG